MPELWTKPPPVDRDRLLNSIVRNQTPERRSVNETMRKVRSVYLETWHDSRVEDEVTAILDEMDLELRPIESGARRLTVNRGGRILVVTGEAGAGKSRTLSMNFLSHEEFAGFGQPGVACTLLSCVAPSPFTLKALGNEIVRKMGYNGKRLIDEGEVWPMVRILMRELGICVLHIDEAQHGDQISNPDIVRNIENTLKRILQDPEWPIWLILSGLPELANFCQGDDSIRRRVHHVRFEPLRFPEHAETVRGTIRKIAAPVEGMDLDAVMSDEFANMLLHASLGQFGIIVEFVQDAIHTCLKSKRTSLGRDHFADAYAARTGETSSEKNVFEAADWHRIDVKASLYEQPLDARGQPIGKERLKRNRRWS